MARGGYASLTIDPRKFIQRLDVVMDRVDRGTRKATVAAAQEIIDDSLDEVPRETDTLAKSVYYNIDGTSKSGFSAEIGYGGNGAINPKSGQFAADYMVVVHEDLQAIHPTGKAKYLEDPVKRYQRRLAPTFARFVRNETGM